MVIQARLTKFRYALGAAVACTLIGGSAVAGSDVTVASRVDTRGYDLSTPAGAHELYLRLEFATRQLCKDDGILVPVPDLKACSEKSLAKAVRSINRPLLTQAYLTNHTPAQAAAHGIEVVAAK